MKRMKNLIDKIIESKYLIKIILIETLTLTILELILFIPFDDFENVIKEIDISSPLFILSIICCSLSMISTISALINLKLAEKESEKNKKMLEATIKYIKLLNDSESKNTYCENLKELQNVEVITKYEYRDLCKLFDVTNKKANEKEISKAIDNVDHVLNRIVENEVQECV